MPEPPSPEPPALCTLESQQQPGFECVECTAVSDEPNQCQVELPLQGYQWRCNTEGVDTWIEIWCKPVAEPEGTGQAEPELEPQPAPPPVEMMEAPRPTRSRAVPMPESAEEPSTPAFPGDL